MNTKKLKLIGFVFLMIITVSVAVNRGYSANPAIQNSGDITSINVIYTNNEQHALKITGTYIGDASHLCVVVVDKNGTPVNGWDDMSDYLKLYKNKFDKSFEIGSTGYSQEKSPYRVYVFTDPYADIPGVGAGENGSKAAIYYLSIDSKGNQELTSANTTKDESSSSYPKSSGDNSDNTTTPVGENTSASTPNPNEIAFKDVATDAWYHKAVKFMAERSIINGTGGGRFEPQKNVTRADFLIMVMKSYNIVPDTTLTENFTDAGNKYYTSYLATAKQLGLVSGVGNNRYAPEATISSQDVLLILYNVLEKLAKLPMENKNVQLDDFRDSGEISSYAKHAVKLFVEAGVVSGDGERLNPKSNSTRAQTAQILYNLLSK